MDSVVIDIDLAKAVGGGAIAMTGALFAGVRWLLTRQDRENARVFATKVDVADAEARIRRDFTDVIGTVRDDVNEVKIAQAANSAILRLIAAKMGVSIPED